ncbi:class I SAM-dependent methyltransferase [Pontibacter akesuensis]|uniref:class I SAM-dependent methyltransferase n=1 Tax=Pontibacter akesuensis TaxID=388950 RepID=UPI001C12AAE8|nr:class I SAM-dependent methyltransferase [Pontibacter akesuensis]
MKQTNRNFQGTDNYWEGRYNSGGNSGAGSYNRLAEFKADVLNSFVKNNQIQTVIEFGCGDGNQLTMLEYPFYIGLDISKTAVGICIDKFKADKTKSFYLYNSLAFVDNHKIFNADVSLSIDVLYHLIEDELFEKYIFDLFNSSKQYVVIYSNDYDDRSALHVRERKFTDYIEKNFSQWKLKEVIKNKYPYDPKKSDQTSSADFFFYQKTNL